MRTLLKFIAGIIGAMILIVIIAMICVMLFFHPNNFKTQLTKQVYTSTGRQLIIGDISWTLFPWLGIKANNVSLSDAPSFDNKIFAQAKQAEIAAKLVPLLHGRLELGQLTVDGLNLNLVKNAQGRTNWQDLMNKTNTASTVSVNSDNETTPVNIKKNFIVILSGITLKNSNLSWIDQQKNKKLMINNLQLDVKSLSLKHPIPVSFSFDINNNDPKFIGSINMQSDVSFNQSQHSISFNDMKTTLTQSDNKYPNGDLSVSLNADANLNLSSLVLSLSNMDANIANMHLQGELQSDPLNNKNIGLHGSLKVPSFNVRDFLSAIGKSANSPIQNSSATFQLQASSSALSLKQLQANIDNIHINGNIGVTNFSNPNYQFKLSADNIDMNRFSSSKSSTVATPNSANNSGSSNQSGLLPIALFKSLNANGDLSINHLTIAKSTITNFYTHIAANNGKIHFNPLNGVIYQGQMHNNISIIVRNVIPQYTITTNFTGIQMGPLLTELADITKIKISGSGNLSANISAAGNNTDAIKQTLSGNAKFSINNGILYGIDIPYYSDVADSLLNKQAPAGNNTHQTSFGNLTATANIKNGLVSNNDLLVQAPDINVTGKGTANLVNEQLDYAMKMQRMVNAAAKGPAIPLMIKGTFSHPSIQPDVTEIIKDQAVKQLEQQATKQLQKALGGSEGEQKLENDVGQQLKKGLKSLFGQ